MSRAMSLAPAVVEHLGPPVRVTEIRQTAQGRVMAIIWYADPEAPTGVEVLVPHEWTVAEVLYHQVTGRMPR